MRLTPLLMIAAVAALAAGAQAPTTNGANDRSNAATPANQAAAPAAAVVGVASSPTPADQAYTLKAGEPNVVSNGPVPDTPENRRLYGGPTSNAGRHTAARGD